MMLWENRQLIIYLGAATATNRIGLFPETVKNLLDTKLVVLHSLYIICERHLISQLSYSLTPTCFTIDC